MSRLVVNADDLGLHARIDEGILAGHRAGIVTSATLLVTGRTAPAAVLAARAQGLQLGVHLALTTHLPPAAAAHQVASVAPGGRFRASWTDFLQAWMTGQVHRAEVRTELRAQVARARDLGADPDHLDGHQHLHVLPGIAGIVAELARDEHLPVRWPVDRPSFRWWAAPSSAAKAAALGLLCLATRPGRGLRALGIFGAGGLDEARLLELVEHLPAGDHELGVHPGLQPVYVPEDPHWDFAWEQELAALCSPSVRDAVQRCGIELTTYRKLGLPTNRTWGVE